RTRCLRAWLHRPEDRGLSGRDRDRLRGPLEEPQGVRTALSSTPGRDSGRLDDSLRCGQDLCHGVIVGSLAVESQNRLGTTGPEQQPGAWFGIAASRQVQLHAIEVFDRLEAPTAELGRRVGEAANYPLL